VASGTPISERVAELEDPDSDLNAL
jgi:hypothetical protein